jgi:hypothetical protein
MVSRRDSHFVKMENRWSSGRTWPVLGQNSGMLFQYGELVVEDGLNLKLGPTALAAYRRHGLP